MEQLPDNIRDWHAYLNEPIVNAGVKTPLHLKGRELREYDRRWKQYTDYMNARLAANPTTYSAIRWPAGAVDRVLSLEAKGTRLEEAIEIVTGDKRGDRFGWDERFIKLLCNTPKYWDAPGNRQNFVEFCGGDS